MREVSIKILCPFHEESTPSLHVYPDGKYYCFGCGKSGFAKDLGIQGLPAPRPPEDITDRLEYIRNLPLQEIRGLHLPADDEGYYILWPNGRYYIKRVHVADQHAGKYRAPRGHRRPLLLKMKTRERVLWWVEGEINALSLAEIVENGTIATPGGAGDLSKHLKFCEQFDTIYVFVDNDSAGVLAALELKRKLPTHKGLMIQVWDKDINDWLQQDGRRKLQEEVRRRVGRI